MPRSRLLEPITLGGLALRNRVFMAPMTRSRADNADAAPSDLHVEYYRQRAGAGLIISEGIVVSPRGTGFMRVPGIYTQKQVSAWRAVTETVHKEGGAIFAQLWHVGRLSHPDLLGGRLPVAPSPVNPAVQVLTPSGKKETPVPEELDIAGIAGIVEEFRSAARNASEAGFDGVEIHASNGYLLHQFFNSDSNRRTDMYGGNAENRVRILFEILAGIRDAVPDLPVGVRLNPMLHGVVGIEVAESTPAAFDLIVRKLDSFGVAYLHLTRPRTVLEKPWFIRDVIGHYRTIFHGVLVANGFYDPLTAEDEVTAGRADAVSFARLFIANPDLPDRIASGARLATPDPATYYSAGPRGYTDYPRIGEE